MKRGVRSAECGVRNAELPQRNEAPAMREKGTFNLQGGIALPHRWLN
jgi:hypothetical protein